MIYKDSADSHQSLVVVVFSFFGLYIDKNYYFSFESTLSYQFSHSIIYTSPCRMAIKQPRLLPLLQGQVSIKSTRGCPRLKWHHRSPAVAY